MPPQYILMLTRPFDIQRYFDTYVSVLQRIESDVVERVASTVFAAWRRGRTVFLCGNGGNAANAMHIAADLVKLTAPADGPRVRAVALGESIPGLTAAANDIAYEQVYAEQLRAFLSPGDLVIGLSTSGSSPNVLRAVEYANASGAGTIGITGLGGDALAARAGLTLTVASTSVQQIEDATMVVGHLVCLAVRDAILTHTSAAEMAARPGVRTASVVPPLARAADIARRARKTGVSKPAQNAGPRQGAR